MLQLSSSLSSSSFWPATGISGVALISTLVSFGESTSYPPVLRWVKCASVLSQGQIYRSPRTSWIGSSWSPKHERIGTTTSTASLWPMRRPRP
ncbi:hypothetical protein FA13DRAFT_1141186 [Coprinellus micaceus]|uniref:Uncharacterized protein n=1 Tax=Coprinellus micaceus TaxID=71717 RepID=A0A4Y7SVT0_COPMI|nr:hypothetical protein FA13DRAFT_1141186 [Coprinellus micaceus]